MSEWKPGDVALVRPIYCDHPDVIAVRTGVPPNMGWSYSMRTSDGSSTRTWASDPDGLTVVRPLVVIDPAANPYSKGTASWIDWIEHEYLAQTRPPKPEEPTGLGAVVEDAEGKVYVRGYWPDDTHTHPWHVIDPAATMCMSWWKYDAIDVAEVLSWGVAP